MRTILLVLVFMLTPLFASANGSGTDAICAQETQQSTQKSPLALLDSLMGVLSHLEGRFVKSSSGWEFEGNREVFGIYATLSDSAWADTAVAYLVECIGRSDPVAATANGRPVLLGFMCYRALGYIAYYEWYDERPINDPDRYAPWAGHLEPTATPNDLERARDAWRDVVRRGVYVLSAAPNQRLHLTRARFGASTLDCSQAMFCGRAAPVVERGRSRAGETHIR